MAQAANWRFRVGVAVFCLGFLAPAAIPLVLASALPPGWKTVLTGALAVGVPELLMIAAAAVMGQEGFAELKHRAGRFLAAHGPPQRVGPTRHRIGLVMFTIPLAVAWLAPYLSGHLPGFQGVPMAWHIGGDVLFVASLFVLGGEFWDKLQALFTHGARATFPDRD